MIRVYPGHPRAWILRRVLFPAAFQRVTSWGWVGRPRPARVPPEVDRTESGRVRVRFHHATWDKGAAWDFLARMTEAHGRESNPWRAEHDGEFWTYTADFDHFTDPTTYQAVQRMIGLDQLERMQTPCPAQHP